MFYEFSCHVLFFLVSGTECYTFTFRGLESTAIDGCLRWYVEAWRFALFMLPTDKPKPVWYPDSAAKGQAPDSMSGGQTTTVMSLILWKQNRFVFFSTLMLIMIDYVQWWEIQAQVNVLPKNRTRKEKLLVISMVFYFYFRSFSWMRRSRHLYRPEVQFHCFGSNLESRYV